jgi:hypothetical protein
MKNTDKSNFRKSISKLSYIPAVLAFIPLIGIPFGISAILWGISDWKIGGKKTVIVTTMGLLSTILFGWWLYRVGSSAFDTYFKSPQLVEQKTENAKIELSFLLRYIEYFKLGHGHYPNTLEELKESNIKFKEPPFIDIFSSPWLFPIGSPGEQQYFYEVQEDGTAYYLFSVGPDKTPHTQDDIYPVVLDDYKSVLGLLYPGGDQSP